MTCNGAKHEISGELLLQARELTRQMSEQAELNLALEPGPNPVLSYKVEMEAGTIAFADTSRPLPRSFTELTVFTKDVSRERLRHRPHLTQIPLALAGAVRYLDVDASRTSRNADTARGPSSRRRPGEAAFLCNAPLRRGGEIQHVKN